MSPPTPGGPPLVTRTWGPHDAPPLLLLHGFLGTGEDWEPVAARLAREHFCIAPDLPGHGLTPYDAAAHGTFETYAGTIAALLHSLDLLRVPAIGYSMGGRVLLWLAVTAPELFTGLVLESASPGIEDDALRAARRREDESLADRIEHERPESFFDWWYGLPLFGGIKACADYAALRQRRLAGDPRQHALALRAAGTGMQPSLWPRLAHITVPMVVVYGDQDSKYSDLAARMVSGSARMTAVPVAGCGHAVHAEQPERFLEICRKFLLAGDIARACGSDL